MQKNLIIYMVVRNVSSRLGLFTQVIKKASQVSRKFYIVNHGSDDNTQEIIQDIWRQQELQINLINEKFEGTMDDMKGKHYRILKEKNEHSKIFLLLLDWDEVLDESLIQEILSLDYTYDVYLLNINTYLIKKVIDKNHFQPRLFQINAVEINNFSAFHNLFLIKSERQKRLNWVLHHYSYENIDALLNKNRYYARGEAQALFEKNPWLHGYSIFFRFLFESAAYFTYTLFYHMNFLHLEGWMYSLNWCNYKLNKYLFYVEMQKTSNNTSEKRY